LLFTWNADPVVDCAPIRLQFSSPQADRAQQRALAK
jgi:hypothetical protein